MRITNNILLIEDEDIGKTFKALIEKSIDGVSVTWVRNKKDAINSFFCQEYQVVVFDQQLGNGELGIDVMRELKKKDDSLVGILLSAYSMPNDTIAAINDDILCDYVNKQNIADIIPAVLHAFQIYQSNRIMKGASIKKYLGKKRRPFWPLHTYRYYLLSKTLTNDEYVFSDQWSQLYMINAGEERCIKNSIELSSSIKYEEEIKGAIESSIEFSNITKLLSSKQNVNMSVQNKTGVEMFRKSYEETVRTYKMPEIPQDSTQNYLTTTIFEGTQIFKEYHVVVMRECGCCKGQTFYNITMYIPTDKQKFRKINTYRDGTQETIEVSIKS